MSANKETILAIDVGGTHQRLASIDRDGNILNKRIYEHSSVDKALFFSQLRKKIEAFLSEERCQGIAVALPATIDGKTRIVYDAPNLSFLVGSNLNEEFSFLSPPWVVENDANCALLGEAWLGEGKECDSFCCLTLGTGIGSGLLLNRKLWTGVRGMASEIGHLKIDFSGLYPCQCGDHGCLEAFASGSALYRKTGYSALKLHEMARAGDPYAREIFDHMGEYLGRGIGSLANALNIEKFVLTGRVSAAFNFFYPSAIRVAKKSAMKGPRERITIVQSKLGDEAGLLGAAYDWLRQVSSLRARIEQYRENNNQPFDDHLIKCGDIHETHPVIEHPNNKSA